MKVMLLGMNKLRFMPYANYYLHLLSQRGYEIHLVMWNRDGREDIESSVQFIPHYFEDVMDDSIKLEKKIPHLIKYGIFMRKVVHAVSPDCLIVMHSTTGFLLGSVATNEYKNRLIFDYRDVTYERFSPYKKAVAKLVKSSAVSLTSSDGFRAYLPDDANILTTHNVINPDDVNRENLKACKDRNHYPIRISFWGRVRHYRMNKLIIDALGGDNRFELHYYGLAQGDILSLLQESCNRYSNVFFHGEYDASDTWKMSLNTDLLHNLYDNSDKTTPLAMGNKYYDGVLYYLPQLCMDGSQMGKCVAAARVGLSCNPESATFADDLVAYYQNLDVDHFVECCDAEWRRIKGELDEANGAIMKFLQQTH